MMRFLLAMMVVGTTMAIQSPNLGQTGFVTTMIEYAPGDSTCQTPVALTYQPTGVCIAASRVNGGAYPSVTPMTQTVGTLSSGGAVTYQSYMYSVSSANAVFISYFTDSFCQTLVLATIPNTATVQAAGDTPVVPSACTLASSSNVGVTNNVGNTIGNTPSNSGGGWEYYTTPFTFTIAAPGTTTAIPSLTIGNHPLSIMNTYANSAFSVGTTPSCSGLPTQVTIQNVALTQMAPFTSGNTCAKSACMAATFYGQPNGAAAGISPMNTNTINVMSQNTCMLPMVSANNGFFLRNYYTDNNCANLDRVDQFQTNVCHPFGAGNIAPSNLALTFTGSAASNTAGTINVRLSSKSNVNNLLPEGLMPTQGTIMNTYSYASVGTYTCANNGGNICPNGVWTWNAGSGTTTNVYVTNYATSTCGSSSVLLFRPKSYNVVGTTTPSCSTNSYIGSLSLWAPLSLTYNVYGSGAYAPVQSYTQSTNSWNLAFSTSISTTSPSTGSNTAVTLTNNPTTQVQKFYATQNDCMSGNMANLGWAQYTNIFNGNTQVTTPACVATSGTTGGQPARNLANLNMCSVPTISTASNININYVMVQQFETATCTGSLGYYYIQLNVCHFVAGSTTTTVMYTLQMQNTASTTSNYNIIQNYYTSIATSTSPVCTGTTLGSSIFGTTGASTVATGTTPLVAATGICMPSGTSYAQFSITAQPTAVSGVMSSYSTASYATSTACTSAYNSNAPTTIGTGSLVQLYVPSSTCNQVMWQMSYQTTASSGSPVVPSGSAPGALYANNILTLDSNPIGVPFSTSIPFGQVTNTGVPSPLPFYSQVALVGCPINAATPTTSTCFTVSQVYTFPTTMNLASFQSTIFLTYLRGAVQSLLTTGNPTTTGATYTDVNFISATAVTGQSNQVTVLFNVQLPSALYGTALATTSPFAGNPFSATTASSTMQTFFAGLATGSNLVGSGNVYSSVTITGTTVTGSGCTTTTTTVQLPGTTTTVPGATTTTIGTNTASNACFADSEVVTMENGMTKSIAEVQIGDRILSADVQGKTSFSDVVYVPHGANTIEATFVMLTTESGRNVKMTTNHILPAGQCGSGMTVRRADAVSTGDCVMTVDGVEKVMDMVTMQGKGIYTVVTNKEYIVVNGIVATPFGGVNPTLANIYYNLHRLVYAFMPQVMMYSQSGVQQVMDTFASLVL